MSEEYIEISAKTLDDAITEACQKLHVPSDRLDYEVIDQGSSGFLGFNAKPAVIKVRAKDSSDKKDAVQGDVLQQVHEEKTAAEAADAASSAPAAEDGEEDFTEDVKVTASSRDEFVTEHRETRYVAHSSSSDDFLSSRSGRDHDRKNRRGRDSRRRNYEYVDSIPAPEAEPHVNKHADEPKVDYSEEQIAEFTKRGEDFLHSMFQAMNMEVEVSSTFDPEENILTVDFEGDDMGVLIGKRGQTLDSIQYLVSLVVNKGLPGYVHVKADTENYRERRRKTLENLARNIASKVKRTHKAVELEPMNPYERRIIHSALQGDRYVTTYSEGEDPYRRVVVAPKR